MAVLSVFLVGISSLTVCFYFYRKFFAFKFFANEGIPGPAPHWLLGNAAAFADQYSRHLVIPKWTKQYGKLFGYFEGSRPTLVTSDVDFVTQVFIKQFPMFHGRKLLPIQPNPDTTTEPITMFIARGDRWKRLRTIVNPTFSAGKLRNLMPLMTKCQNDFMELIERRGGNGQEFNIFECFKMLTLDTISETAFGVELNSAKIGDECQNPMLRTLNEMFRTIFQASLAMKIAIVLPELSPFLRKLEFARARLPGANTMMKTRNELLSMIEQIILARKNSQTGENQRTDLLQMMIELEESNVESSKLLGQFKGLTLGEIKGQSMLFMIAGFETSSNTLAFIAFLLANNQQAQEKLLTEIDEHFSAPEKLPDYDNVQELPYMDCVLNEALRLYPVAPILINRMAMASTEINGIRIPYGLSILADVWSLHRDEEQWGPVDPEKFFPERFLDDYPTKGTRNDSAFLPFGIGPRICIGMRFAQLEIKLTLVNLLRKYRIEKSPLTGDEIKLRSAFTIAPVDGIFIRLIKRH